MGFGDWGLAIKDKITTRLRITIKDNDKYNDEDKEMDIDKDNDKDNGMETKHGLCTYYIHTYHQESKKPPVARCYPNTVIIMYSSMYLQAVMKSR